MRYETLFTEEAIPPRRRPSIDLTFDYRDARSLAPFIAPGGKILPRRITGLSAKQQRALARAIKRARHIGVLPYAAQH